MTPPKIRPSALPKLALCGQYEGDSRPSPAALRGTRLDQLFREGWLYGVPGWFFDEPEMEPVLWALAKVNDLGGRAEGFRTEEDACKVRIPGFEREGTADGVSIQGRWLVDLKSGQEYDYSLQMAAYAWGFMQQTGADHWMTYLLFCDQKKVVPNLWSVDTARAAVTEALANVGTAPRENQFCTWCAKSLTCEARLQAKDAALVPVGEAAGLQSARFLEILRDPVQVGEFLLKARTLEDFVEAAKQAARKHLEAGDEVPGVRLGAPRSLDFVEAQHLVQAVAAGKLSMQAVVHAYGSMPAKRAAVLFETVGVKLPENVVTKKQSVAPLVVKTK
jgi:hypothetical protein